MTTEGIFRADLEKIHDRGGYRCRCIGVTGFRQEIVAQSAGSENGALQRAGSVQSGTPASGRFRTRPWRAVYHRAKAPIPRANRPRSRRVVIRETRGLGNTNSLGMSHTSRGAASAGFECTSLGPMCHSLCLTPSSSTSEVTLFHLRFRKLPMAPHMRCRTGFRSLEHIQQRDK
jgi:hypothetical protein